MMSDKTTVDNEAAMSEERVSEFLQNNPDFFVNHPQLLAELRLPHDSKGAISLVERQVSILRERNMDMRHRLSKLLDNARDNDKLFEKTKRLILTLLEAQDLGDVVDALMYSFENEFKIHYTTLLLYGNPHTIPPSAARIVSLSEARDHIGLRLKTNRAVCGALSLEERHFLFREHADDVGSTALVPLVHGSAYGLLAIGNRDPKYYSSSMGTLFLNYIAEVLNRLVPGYLRQ